MLFKICDNYSLSSFWHILCYCYLNCREFIFLFQLNNYCKRKKLKIYFLRIIRNDKNTDHSIHFFSLYF